MYSRPDYMMIVELYGNKKKLNFDLTDELVFVLS